MDGQYRVARPAVRDVTLGDDIAQPPVATIGSQGLELAVQVENQRGEWKTPRLTVRARMQADDIETAATNAQAELR